MARYYIIAIRPGKNSRHVEGPIKNLDKAIKAAKEVEHLATKEGAKLVICEESELGSYGL